MAIFNYTDTLVPFGDSAKKLSQNTNFRWDDTNGRLGVGNPSPSALLSLRDLTAGDRDLLFINTAQGRQVEIATTAAGEVNHSMLDASGNTKITLSTLTSPRLTLGEAGAGTASYVMTNATGNTLTFTSSAGNDALEMDTSGTLVFKQYGAGNREAGDLSKTDSGYFLKLATDGTLIEAAAGTDTSAFYNTGTTTPTGDTTTSAFRTGQTAFGADTFVGTRELTVTGTASVRDALNNVLISGGTESMTGAQNTAVGYLSLNASTADSANTAIGYTAMLNTNGGSNNTAIGAQSLIANTTGDRNVALGTSSLVSSTTASDNTALGYGTLTNTTTGTHNVAVGRSAGSLNTTGAQNTYMGRDAGRDGLTASNNVAIGYNSLLVNTTGLGNTAIGYQSATANLIGDSNTTLGYNSLTLNTTGSNNIIVGSSQETERVTTDNELNIGGILGGDVSIKSIHFDDYGQGTKEIGDLTTRTLTTLGVATTSETLATSTIVFAAVHGLSNGDILRFEDGANNTDDLTVTVVDTTTITVTPALNADDAGNTPFIVTTPGKTDSGYLAGFATDGTIIEVTPTAATVTAAANGLSLNGTTVELGGSLTKLTTISGAENNFNLLGTGQLYMTTTTAAGDATSTYLAGATAALGVTMSNALDATPTTKAEFVAKAGNTSVMQTTDGTITGKVEALASGNVEISSTDGTTTAELNAAVFYTEQVGQVRKTSQGGIAITAQADNASPTNFKTSAHFDVILGGNQDITGLDATDAVTGTIVTFNVFTADLTFKHQDASSLAANRFTLPNSTDVTIKAGGGGTLRYNSTGQWMLVGVAA